ncbi:MAG TPA: PDZ domain-containing protein [Phycisphaerae bacterium]|nr:PDZ domain-containing protein [Phycisphaerae bacterium]
MEALRLNRAFPVVLAAALAGGPAAAHAATDFGAQAKEIARRQVEKFGKGYAARIDPSRHIVYVSALDDGHLRETIQLLSSFTDAYRRALPSTRPAWNVTVVLPTVDDYKKLPLPFPDCAGFYNPAGRRLVAIDRGRTLLHEFVHALHHADMAASRQVHPIWVSEGLATLFEASRITPSGLKPQLDRRLVTVQRAVRAKKAFPLKRLLTMGRSPFMTDAALAYAQARYVMYYLHDRGHLAGWYRRYKATFTHDPNGLKAFEAALVSRVFLIDPAWQKWVLTLRVPSSEYRTHEGRLGLRVQKVSQGVQVVGMVPGSAAKVAGRIRVGDLIEKFNNRVIRNTGDFVSAIRQAGAMQTVTIQVLRHGRRLAVIQPLGAPSTR